MDINASGNEAWKVESHGINVVPDVDKRGTPRDLFWIWFAANIGILGVVYGGLIETFRLSLAQSMLVAVIGALSFAIVGVLSVAGRNGSAPMLMLSRAVFGERGNVLPTLVSWINLVGWEAVTVITGTLTVEALIQALFHVQSSFLTTIIGMIIFAGLVVLFGLLGQATLVVVQKVATWVFGALTLVVIALLLQGTHWHTVLAAPNGSWISGFLPAVSIIIAGTGISWGNVAADYSRYQSRYASTGSIVSMVTLGGAIPLLALMLTGILLTSRVPNLAFAANPISAIGGALPAWMAIPYLFTAVGGMIAEADLSLYSSGLNLMTLGVRLARHKTVAIDAVIMIGVTSYVLFVSQNFLAPFQSFLTLMGIGLAAWEAVFMVDQWLGRRATVPRREFRWPAMIAWTVGIVIGLLFSGSTFFNGPWAVGIFAGSGLGVLVTLLISGLIYGVTAKMFDYFAPGS